MRRREYEWLWLLRHRWPQDMRGAPRRFLIAFGATIVILFAFWLILTAFGG